MTDAGIVTTSALRDRPPTPPAEAEPTVSADSPEAFFNRELSWLGFASRVIALVEDPAIPLLERVKFAGISGMLHDEFFMKRISGIKRQMRKGSRKRSADGRTPEEEFTACREELLRQASRINAVLVRDILPALHEQGIGIREHHELNDEQRGALREYFRHSVAPILTPLAVDPEHPFPFISNLGLNLAVILDAGGGRERFVRIKVPNNRPRWIALPDGEYTPLGQVIAANLDLLYPGATPKEIHFFRVTRGAEGDRAAAEDLDEGDPGQPPGSIVQQVRDELKARRFAGVVRLQVDPAMPERRRTWLAEQLGVDPEDVYETGYFLGLADLSHFAGDGREDLRYPPHKPVTHRRLRGLSAGDSGAMFDEIGRGDVLLHHPYHSFDTSVLRFIEAAAADPQVLAIKLTIYRTSSDSPIVQALADAARSGKQVAVLVEVTARFDEAPNIAWGKYLEQEGVHVAYGVERLKTHVKLALAVREELRGIRRYAHVGTGNYHPGTATIYEDLGILTADPEICEEVASVFNTLTGTTPYGTHLRLLIAPTTMRARFVALVRREAEHARAGRPSGIHAKMNQLQDPEMIRELYGASQAGVPIALNVRGLCCLRPGVPGLSDTVRVFGVVGRFLEHSRIYRFDNAGVPEYYIGSADWMRRNLSRRVETVAPVFDPSLQGELDRILTAYDEDNCSVWDCRPDGSYVRRRPAPGEPCRAVQEMLMEVVKG